ncbi:MAG: hypothetical protein EYC70_02725 [Planctomycetota bacterium]|nr:MAG: hypothetical protein EYC70_02725 [Planctomycetota bacterium]
MRRLLLAVALCTLPMACAGQPQVHEGAIIRGGQEVAVEVRDWVEDLEVSEVVGRKDGERTAVQFRLANTRDEPMRVQLTWEWADHDGILLRSAVDERQEEILLLRSGQERVKTFLSPTEKAVRFTARLVELVPREH